MKNILLIGLGRFGRHVAIHLNEMGYQIMAVDKAEDKVNEFIDYVTSAVIGDSTNRDFLKSLGIANYDVCFVTIGGNFQNSLETTYQLKELGAKCVISRAERDVQAKFLLKNTKASVKDICYNTGFSSESSFCVAFKKKTGHTPAEYRNRELS